MTTTTHLKVALGELASKIGSGVTPSGGSRAYLPAGTPLIRSQNVLMNAFSGDGLVFISDEQNQKMKGSRVYEGDVLLNITGASIGRVCVVPSEVCPANVNQHVCIIRSLKSLDADYLAFFISSPEIQSFIFQSQAGGTRQALTKDIIENFEIPLPPLAEQKRIAAQLKAQLAEVEKARQGLEAQQQDAELLLVRIQAEEFAALGKDSLVHCGELLQGIEAGKSLKTTEQLAREDQLAILKVSAVSWQAFQPDEAKALDEGYEPPEHHVVKKGDILLSRANTQELVGAVVRVQNDYPFRLLSDKTLRLIPDEERVLPDYLVHALRSPIAREFIEHNATGSSESIDII